MTPRVLCDDSCGGGRRQLLMGSRRGTAGVPSMAAQVGYPMTRHMERDPAGAVVRQCVLVAASGAVATAAGSWSIAATFPAALFTMWTLWMVPKS